jgi:hypothetical protein
MPEGVLDGRDDFERPRSSSLLGDLRGLVQDVRENGGGERILPHQIVERYVRRADGELEPLTATSNWQTSADRSQ